MMSLPTLILHILKYLRNSLIKSLKVYSKVNTNNLFINNIGNHHGKKTKNEDEKGMGVCIPRINKVEKNNDWRTKTFRML